MRTARLLLAAVAAAIFCFSCNARGANPPETPAGPPGGINLTPKVVQVGNPRRWRTFRGPFNAVKPDPNGPFMWFSDSSGNRMVRMSMDGSLLPIRLGSASSPFTPHQFSFGSDRTLYIGGCVNATCNAVGVLSPNRKQFSIVNTPSGDSIPDANEFVLGPDGNVWFLEQTHIAKITPQHQITEYASPISPLGPDMANDAEGHIWFDGEAGEGNCSDGYGECPFAGWIDPTSGTINWTFLGQVYGSYDSPYEYLNAGIGNGPDGQMMFIVHIPGYYYGSATYLEAVTSDLDQHTFQYVPADFNNTKHPMTDGPNGTIWWGNGGGMGEYNFHQAPIRHLAPSHVGAVSIAQGPDGNMWGVDKNGNAFVYIINVLYTTPARLSLMVGAQKTLTVHYLGSSSLTVTSQKPGIASVAKMSNGYVVTGRHAGKTKIVVNDQENNSFAVPVTVE